MNTKHSFVYILAFSFVLFTYCDNSTDPPPKPPVVCDDIPYDSSDFGGGPISPFSVFGEGRLSYGSKSLAYGLLGELFILDLETINQRKLEISFPDHIRLAGILGYHWCPYDFEVLLIDAKVYTDTSGNWSKYASGVNTYIVDAAGNILRRVTPQKYPSWGAPGPYGTVAWLHGSTEDADSLLMSSNGIVVPQGNLSLEPKYWPWMISQNGSNWFGTNELTDRNLRVNGHQLIYDGYQDRFNEASFSPSGKYLAIAGFTTIEQESIKTPNLWILDIETWLQDPSQPAPIVSSINFQKQFCMYTAAGAYPVFLTENTLAVSMFPAYAEYAHYYEIDLEGNLIRQLSQEL